MDLQLTGKTAIVTGASRGIGRAVAELLSAEGANVLGVARHPEATPDVPFEMVAADITNADAASLIIDAAMERWPRIEMLVHCAALGAMGPISELTDDQWMLGMNTKFLGAVRLVRAAAPRMSHGGRIVLMSGFVGRRVLPYQAPGGAANAALMLLAAHLAAELAPSGIAVNTVSPGPIGTQRWEGVMEFIAKKRATTRQAVEREMLASIPAGRFGKVEDVAPLVVFLCSPLASYVNGTTVTVDGGWSRGT